MKTITPGKHVSTETFMRYMEAKHHMAAEPTLEHVIQFVDAAVADRGRLTAFHYDVANVYLKKCP